MKAIVHEGIFYKEREAIKVIKIFGITIYRKIISTYLN